MFFFQGTIFLLEFLLQSKGQIELWITWVAFPEKFNFGQNRPIAKIANKRTYQNSFTKSVIKKMYFVRYIFGVRLAEKISKIISRWRWRSFRTRFDGWFGGSGNRKMFRTVWLLSASHSVSIWPKKFWKSSADGAGDRFGPDSADPEIVKLQNCSYVVSVVFGVHLAEKILKIVSRWFWRSVRDRFDGRFGGYENRRMFKTVCTWSTSYSVSIWPKKF